MENKELVKKISEIMRSLPLMEENPIDHERASIPPFIGEGEIKLIIIGQDPTIRNVKRRDRIKCTLNLDKGGALKTYLERIITGLGLQFENVYATNLFKYFYTNPPKDTPTVLEAHLEPNLKLLKEEIDAYPDAIVITLGEPVLQLLTDIKHKVRKYWNWQGCGYHCLPAKENKLGRIIFPFNHIGSYRFNLYKEGQPQYINYIKKTRPDINKNEENHLP